MTFSHPLLREGWRRARYLVTRFSADRCSENAAALTYMSLFALVPLLTVLYTMASAIPTFQGVEEQIQVFLFKHVVPQSSAAIEEYLNEFSQQARNLTGPGIAFLVVTAILMLRNIEHAFNHIWRARENRGAISSFLLYWAVLTLVPVTIGFALALNTYLSTFTQSLTSFELLGANTALVQLASLGLSTLGFTLIYAAVPNCPVPLKHALLGGVFTALSFHIARAVFTQLMVSSSITFIYGAFAAVPLFLMWIYVSWNIVLTGGILVHSLSAYASREQARRPAVLKALDVLYIFWLRQQSGDVVREMELLNRKHETIRGMDSETWGHVRDVLLRENVIAENRKGHYLLSRDLHTVLFWQLKEWIDGEPPLGPPDTVAGSDWQRHAYRMLHDERETQRDILHANLVELFGR